MNHFISQLLPYLYVYESTLHLHGQKSDFSSFLLKEVTFKQIEISQSIISENVLKTQGIKKTAEQNEIICCKVY